MANKMYEGKGNSIDSAIENMYDVAKKAGIEEQPVSYAVSITSKRGKVLAEANGADYKAAFNSAVELAREDANVTYDAKKHVIVVQGEYPVAEKARPSPCSPLEATVSRRTDLF